MVEVSGNDPRKDADAEHRASPIHQPLAGASLRSRGLRGGNIRSESPSRFRAPSVIGSPGKGAGYLRPA